MNDVFTCIKMHTVWHLMVLLQFISFIIWDINCITRLLRLISGDLTDGERSKRHFSRPRKLCHLEKNRKRSLGACFSRRLSLSVVQSLRMALHSLQWRLMVFWPTGEECQLSPQLHTKAKSQSGVWDQRSPMMWLDPTQSIDTGSWPLATTLLMG